VLPIGSLVVVAIALLSLRSNPLPVSQQKNAEYVDAATCATCHAEIAKRYSHTGMASSLSTPDSGKMPEDFTRRNTLFHKPSGNYYTMVRRGDSFYQRRYQMGRDGKKTNIVEKRIDYVIGSGDQARSYLHRTNDNRLLELPVT